VPEKHTDLTNSGSKNPSVWDNHGNRRATVEFTAEELSELCFSDAKKVLHVLACFYLLSQYIQ